MRTAMEHSKRSAASTVQADMKRKLPNGWRWVKLGEVCNVFGGSTPDSGNKEFWDGHIVWVTPTDLGKLSEIEIISTARSITNSGLQSCGTEIIPKGAVIMSSRAPIGYLAIAGVSLCTNQGCKSFIPGPEIDSIFLFWTLKKSIPDVQALGSGATFKEVSKSALQQFEIPLPALPEQQRIAGVLKKQMAAVDKARKAAQERLEAVKALPAAFLRQVFPKPDHPLPAGWRWVRLGDVCEKQTGIRDPRLEPNTLFHYVDITSVSNIYKRITDAKIFLGKEAPSRARQIIRAEDIIVSTTRPNLNAVARIPALLDNQICSTGFCVLRTGVDILSEYLFAFVQYESFVRALSDLVKGALYPAVNDNQVKAQLIPLPTISEQRRIIELFNEKMKHAEKTRTAAESELDTINAMPSALLRRAFNGEL